jgi:hypothetical protein
MTGPGGSEVSDIPDEKSGLDDAKDTVAELDFVDISELVVLKIWEDHNLGYEDDKPWNTLAGEVTSIGYQANLEGKEKDQSKLESMFRKAGDSDIADYIKGMSSIRSDSEQSSLRANLNWRFQNLSEATSEKRKELIEGFQAKWKDRMDIPDLLKPVEKEEK